MACKRISKSMLHRKLPEMTSCYMALQNVLNNLVVDHALTPFQFSFYGGYFRIMQISMVESLGYW